jgi:MoaA/NifB/PqqE/SkfB family radical SAM enzyme
MAVGSLLWPRLVERRLRPLRDRVVAFRERGKPPEERRWRLWQVEVSLACELECRMCPWRGLRGVADESLLMSDAVWDRLRPHLGEVATLDLTGGGEPLLHPELPEWIAEAKRAGCEVGFLSNAHPLDAERARAVLDAGVDWLAFSIDGADAEVYEDIRRGASFVAVTENVRRLAAMREGKRPRIALNFVVMERNAHQMEAIVRLAAELGVEQVNFKQCDVSRGELGRGLGLFRAASDRDTRRHEKALRHARRTARKLGIATTAFSFTPEEEPVCDQDPRRSLFVRWDGRAAPCINKAYGGPTTFFDEEVELPEVHYGSVLDASPPELWDGEACRQHREGFGRRVAAHDHRLLELGPGLPLEKLERATEEARAVMPPPPSGCEVCHYLHGT